MTTQAADMLAIVNHGPEDYRLERIARPKATPAGESPAYITRKVMPPRRSAFCFARSDLANIGRRLGELSRNAS